MSFRRLFTGPTLPTLETEAFRVLSDTVNDYPESVLYIGNHDHPREGIIERWKDYGPSACLRIDTFDDLVTDCYEQDQYEGRVTHVDRPLLFRLVELGVESIDSPRNPFHTGGDFPRSGLVQEAEEVFTELEFAGLLSPEEMRSRLVEEGVNDRANHVAELATEIEAARSEILADELPETYRTERMEHVVTMDTSLEAVLPSVDAVVLGGFTRFDALERDLLKRIIETWPTIALLPKQIDENEATGVDAGITRALETYEELGFSRTHYTDSPTASTEARRRLTRNLYRHPDHSPLIDGLRPDSLNITYAESETVPDEIREVAREIRSKLSTGTQPDEIGVVLTSPTEYADLIQEVFDMYGLPFSLETETQLTETALGEVVETVCQLSREPRSIDTLLDLLTNPLVSATHAGDSIDHYALSRVASRAETNRLETVLEHADDTVSAAVESLLRDTTALTTTNLDELQGRLDALLERLGVLAAIEGEREHSPRFQAREASSYERLNRVLETLELTTPLADVEIGDSVDRLERALSGVSIGGHGRTEEDCVIVCSLSESYLREFEHVYVLGMTSSHVPSDPDRMAFTQPIYEAHPDFEQADRSIEARYHVGALLGSDASIRMSAPQRSLSGEPYVEADILTELGRFLDLSEITIEEAASDPGYQEDVQRAIGNAFAETTESRCRSFIRNAVDAGTYDSEQHTRIEFGVECAAARADSELSQYDGQLSPEMVSQVHATTDREPFSASRLETYAACGFKYYMYRVLGIEAPDPLQREPDASVRGSYIHDVLEHYYLSLQSTDGEPVHPGGDFEERQKQLLNVATDPLDDAFGKYPATAFHDEWLTQVLAGLGTPEENPYYGPVEETDDGRPVARGIFYRFLEHEFEEPAKTTARPTWFEARIGQPHEGGTSVSEEPAVIETPHGPVPVHGLIDRVDTVPGTNPEQAVVRDYKTGSSTPGENDALLGLNFQLPLYALMAEDALDGIETVGAAYYQVSPPSSVNSRSGLVTSQEMADYYRSDDVDVPLLRYSYPHFESHDAFRAFIEDITPRRLGELATGIANGRYHPTVLDPSDAGCRYCDYASVCDVRSHKRREIIGKIDDAGMEAYVPPMARDIAPEELVEVE